MAEIRLLTPQELEERSKPKRQRRREEKERIINHFLSQLTQAKPGYGGEVHLGAGEDKRRTRGLLHEAANRIGLNLSFRHIRDPQRLEFLIIEDQERSPGNRTGARRRGTTRGASR